MSNVWGCHKMKLKKIDIKEINGFRLGNAEDPEAGTGVTVIIADDGAVAGVDVRGGAPATRETDLIRSENTVEKINAVVLSGGSAFGLEAASGVMRALAEKGQGFKVGDVTVPIVAGASLFDLQVGKSDVFPDVMMGAEAVSNAYGDSFESGNHGAGTGASVGKMLGMDRAMKTGLGTFACGDELIQVGAISAVNACADIYNGAGNIIAGLRNAGGNDIQGTVKVLKGMIHPESKPDLDLYEIRRMAEEESRSAYEDEVPESTGNEKDDIARALRASYELEQAQIVLGNSSDVPETEPEAEPENESVLPADIQEEPVMTEAPSETEPVIPEETYTVETYHEVYEEPEVSEIPSYRDEEPEEESPATEEPEITRELPSEPEDQYISYEEASSMHSEVTEAMEEEEDPEPEEDDEYQLTQEDRDDMGYDITFNTTISCVITNAIITKAQANKLASILHDAYARAIKPVHTTMDGDTVFVLSTCTQEVNFDAFAALATDVLQYAIIDGAHSAESAYGLPAARDIIRK